MELLTRVERALDEHDDDAVDDAVRELIEQLDDVADEQLAELCKRIRANRTFDALGLLADTAIASGRTGRFWSDLVQAHIERGRYATADAVIERGLATDLADEWRLSLRGLQGRIHKDRYVSHGSADDLVAAIDAYASAIREGGDPLWLGINAHALAHRARRDGVEIPDLDIPDERSVLDQATARSATDDWAAATAIEASLLIGLPLPVDTIVTRLAGASPFVHASLRRQLIEVWGLPDDHPAIVTLSEFLLRVGSNASIELPRDPSGFEKLFGSEWPVPIDTYRQGLTAAESVAHVLLRGQVPIGTGFLIDGATLHPDLAGRCALLTNEHVVPTVERADGAPADALTVRFDAHETAPIDDLRPVFWSDRDDLDVCVLVSDALDAADLPVLTPSDRLPAVMPGAHVYVVGHPGGRSLCLSVRGNDLIDHDGVRIHYRAPTEKGSSGSPVFDEAWQLVGIHHYGSSRLPRLHGKTGTYGGNEGTSFAALRRQMSERGLAR